MSKEQLDGAAEAILLPARTAKREPPDLRANRRATLRWLVAPITGLGIGGLLSLYFTGHALPWNLVGLGIGMVISVVLALRAA